MTMTGEEVREWMAERNLRIATVAKALGVTRRGVDGWRKNGCKKVVTIALNACFPIPRKEDHQQ